MVFLARSAYIHIRLMAQVVEHRGMSVESRAERKKKEQTRSTRMELMSWNDRCWRIHSRIRMMMCFFFVVDYKFHQYSLFHVEIHSTLFYYSIFWCYVPAC